ncbi:hypothetical protein AB1Y20_007324 [Prymnesium parvum]|uniref:Uncharacterized protein n=1 Tax=Prymnesium parvum TaxID=97485 RepID=A0AB34IX99_PRYPA
MGRGETRRGETTAQLDGTHEVLVVLEAPIALVARALRRAFVDGSEGCREDCLSAEEGGAHLAETRAAVETAVGSLTSFHLVLAGSMLFAEKENLASSFRLRMLTIRDKELDFFMRNMQNVANLSALLAGFGQSGLIYTKYIDLNLCGADEILCAEFTYPLAVTLTMCLALFSMWGCMLVTMLAPGLALRGPQGSMDLCVNIVAQEYQCSVFIFSGSLVMLMVSTVLWSWTKLQFGWPAAFLTLLSVGSLQMIILVSMRVMRKFNVPRSKLVTGRICADRRTVRRTTSSPPPLTSHGYTRLHDEPPRHSASPPRLPSSPPRLSAPPPRLVRSLVAKSHDAVFPPQAYEASARALARAWRRSRGVPVDGAPAATTRWSDGSCSPPPLLARSQSEALAAGAVGMTRVQEEQLLLLQRAEALGSIARQSAGGDFAGGWIGLSAEEELELRLFRERVSTPTPSESE